MNNTSQQKHDNFYLITSINENVGMISRKCKTHIVNIPKNPIVPNDSTRNNSPKNQNTEQCDIPVQDVKKQKIFKSRYVKTSNFFIIIFLFIS